MGKAVSDQDTFLSLWAFAHAVPSTRKPLTQASPVPDDHSLVLEAWMWESTWFL